MSQTLKPAPPPPSAALQPVGVTPKATAAPKMPIFAHLQELRRRLIYALLGVGLTTSISFAYAPQLFAFLQRPLQSVATAQKMIVLTPLEMFITYIKLAVTCGIFIAMPFLLLQLWLFIAPGLYPQEKRWIVPFVLLGTAFFVGGAAFCFYGVLPASFQYLVDMVPLGVEAHYSVSSYFSLLMQLMLAFGLVFELPLVMTLLGAAGLVQAPQLAKFRKYWLIVAVFLGGVLTPTPDPMTQMMMAIPLVLFYELGILGVRLARRAKAPVKSK